MKRLFTFGCSFTSYVWPTWADILGLEYDHYENWGEAGSSNQYIMYSVNEFLTKNTITQDDTIIIMWTDINRTVEFKDGTWCHKFKEDKNDSDDDWLISNLNSISSVSNMLEDKCNFYMLSMIEITEQKFKKNYDNIINIFSKTLDKIYPSQYNILFNYNWRSLDHVIITDINDIDINELREIYIDIHKPGWPNVDDFIDEKYIRDDLVLTEQYDQELKEIEFTRNAVQNSIPVRSDGHPTPMEHLEYLIKLDIFEITPKQLAQAEIWNEPVIHGKYTDEFKNLRAPIQRFATKNKLLTTVKFENNKYKMT